MSSHLDFHFFYNSIISLQQHNDALAVLVTDRYLTKNTSGGRLVFSRHIKDDFWVKDGKTSSANRVRKHPENDL